MSVRQRPPSIDALLRDAALAPAISRWGRLHVKRCATQLLNHARDTDATRDDATWPIWATDAGQLTQRIHAQLAKSAPALRPVLNLTGTLLHTNLGRALLPQCAVDAVTAAALRPVNLEFDLQTGERGRRESEVETLLCELTGAEAATVVNNGAAALLLLLNSLALGKHVPVSRGELIEIGGSFRLPELMERSGCTLREVGTTNRTHLRDFASALASGAALILRVHPSNFAIAGFTHTVPARELAELAHAHNVPFVVDLGSGALIDYGRYGLPHESLPQELLADGADLVTFSGDKLLGGPQAGLIVGRRDLVDALDRNPLKRALRADKLTLAALAEVLKLYGDSERLERELPLLQQLSIPLAELRARGAMLCNQLATRFAPAFSLHVQDTQTEVGSGALPTAQVPSVALAFVARTPRGASAHLEGLATALRHAALPVIGRIHEQRLLLDLRGSEDDAAIIQTLAEVAAALRANAT